MSETDGVSPDGSKSPRRASPVASVIMVLVGGVVWFFLHNLAPFNAVVDLVIAAVVGLVVGFVAQEVAAHRRR